MRKLIATTFTLVTMALCLPAAATAVECTLPEFLQAVAHSNPDLQLAQRDLELASVQKREARSLALPMIAAQGNYSRNLKRNYLYVDMPAEDSLGNLVEVPMSFPINRNNDYSFNLVMNQTLFSFNVGYALKAAGQYETLSSQIYRASRQGILTWARKAFYSTLLLEKVLEITEAAAVNAQENFRNQERRFNEGLASEFQRLQAEVRWQSLLPEVAAAKRNLELALNNLRQMAGWPLDRELQLAGDLENLPPLPPLPDLEEVLISRPDYNALLWEEKLRQTGLKVERSGYFPSLSGSFVYRYSAQADDWVFDENRNNSWIAGVTLNIPIFTGGYTSARVQRAQLELNKNQLRLERQRREIHTELENIQLRLKQARARCNAAATTLTAAAKAFQIAEEGAATGLVSQLELKDARLFYDQAQLGRYSAAWEYLDAWLDWQLALGEADLAE